jgi:hypothetical protein
MQLSPPCRTKRTSKRLHGGLNFCTSNNVADDRGACDSPANNSAGHQRRDIGPESNAIGDRGDYYGANYMPSLTLRICIRANSGDCHVTQIRTCDSRCKFAGRRQLGTNPRVCLVRRLARWWLGLGRWMGTRVESWLGTWLGTWLGRLGMASRLGLGWTTFRCGAGILRGRMRRSATRSRSVGPALDSREPVLVVKNSGGEVRVL